MKNLFFALALGLGAVLLSPPATAQTPGSTGPTPQSGEPTSVPIDCGASLLLAGGLGYGLRLMRQSRRA